MSRTVQKRTQRHKVKHIDRTVRKKLESPCNRPPSTPTGLTGSYQRHPGRKRHNHWEALLKWDEVSTDTSGFTVRIQAYKLEVEWSANGTDWFLHNRFHIPAKQDDDPNDKVHKHIKNIHGRLAYRFRVLAILAKGCTSEWPSYFSLGTPSDAPPAPSDVKILRRPHGIRLRWRAPVDDEDDEIFTQDVVGFVARLWTNEDFGPIKAFTALASNDTFTATAHGFANDDPVMLRNTPGGSSLPTGVLPFKLYFVTNVTANTFKLAREEDGAAIDLTTDGSGDVLWGLVRVQRHIRKHHVDFRIDPDDFDEDLTYYGQVLSESDHRSKSAFIPATAPIPNDDPGATPTGRRPSWERRVMTFNIPGPLLEASYNPPNRWDDDYRIRRVTGAAGTVGSGGTSIIDVQVKSNGTYDSIFNDVTADMLTFAAGDDDASTKAITTRDVARGDKIRLRGAEINGTPPEDLTVQIIADRLK